MPAHTQACTQTGWHEAMDEIISSNPLFVPNLSTAGVQGIESVPRAIFVGIGLCTRRELGLGLPLDVLGILLPAEQLRVALGAEHLVVLVADAHAESNGFSTSNVGVRARATGRALLRLRQSLKLSSLRLIWASKLQEETGYQAFLKKIRIASEGEGNEYMYRQTADVAFLNQELGGLLKLGWTVDIKGKSGGGYRDEVAFDRLVHPWSGESPAFAYVRCARAFSNRTPKVSPYIGVDWSDRIYLDVREDVDKKLKQARLLASKRNVAASLEHLSLVADIWGARGETLAPRLNKILSDIYPGRKRAFLSSEAGFGRVVELQR